MSKEQFRRDETDTIRNGTTDQILDKYFILPARLFHSTIILRFIGSEEVQI